MQNNRVIEMAVNYCLKYLVNRGVGHRTSTATLRDHVRSWYNNTDITDPEILAAAAMEFGLYEHLPMSILEQNRDMYFGCLPVKDEDDTTWVF